MATLSQGTSNPFSKITDFFSNLNYVNPVIKPAAIDNSSVAQAPYGPMTQSGNFYSSPQPVATPQINKTISANNTGISNFVPVTQPSPSGNQGGGSNSGGGSSISRPDLNLAPNMGGTDANANDYWNQMKAAADAGDQAARDSLNAQYDRQESQLYGQLGTAESNKNLTLTDILNSLSTTQKGIEKQKTESQQAVADETARAAQAAQGTQRTNRNVLRALGILNSTYSADALQKPMNEFDMERNRLTNIGIQNIGKLDEGLNAAKAEAETQKNKVIAQFNDIVGKINSDIRFSQAERTNALNASRAALQQRMADIQGQKFNYEQQAQQLRQNFITDLAKIQASANPTQANISNIMKSIAFSSPQTANTQQAQIFNGQRNGLAQGFSMANYPGWDKTAAYEDYKKKNGL